METISHRPWEKVSPPQSQPQQTLPSIAHLTANMDNTGRQPPERNSLSLNVTSSPRNSRGFKPPSAGVNNTMPYLTSSSHHSPSNPLSASNHPSPYTPDSAGPPQPNFPPSHQASAFNHNDYSLHRGSGDFNESRRSSVDSRIHQGISGLALGPASPYASGNPSQTSLVGNLQRERGIQPIGYRGPRFSSGSGPISPYGIRNGDRNSFSQTRVAPPIMENPGSEVYNADVPTRGQAYAFPDPDSHPSDSRPPSNFSRRNSYAESFTSSIYSDMSRQLPQGQQELPGNTHHHTLQHKQIDEIRDQESPNSTTPYSRTPELRVTHKLAERKRRSEMKDCFEQLRVRLPAGQTNKSSKWETLSRAIDYINALESQNKQLRAAEEHERGRTLELEHQLEKMRQKMQHSGSYPPPPNVMPSANAMYYSNGIDGTAEPARTLPPLMNGNVNGAMQGIQYPDDRR